jgi:hypothetical protein
LRSNQRVSPHCGRNETIARGFYLQRATNMSDHTPNPAGRSRFRDSTFLLAVAVVAIVCGALSFYMQKAEYDPAVTASAIDEPRSRPLPAGPRKYQ